MPFKIGPMELALIISLLLPVFGGAIALIVLGVKKSSEKKQEPRKGAIFCRNCGKELSPKTEICMSCGVRPPNGDKFCWNCGVEVSPAAELCIKCGTRLMKAGGKNKTTAVILAVFLSYWTWLYTYRKDNWKFWLNLGLTIITIGFWAIAAWIWAMVDAIRRPDEWYASHL